MGEEQAADRLGKTCPACHCPCNEKVHKCPECDRYWVIEDPDPPPLAAVLLGRRLTMLRDATQRCAGGFERSDYILWYAEMALDEYRRTMWGALSREQRQAIEACMRGLQRIQGFYRTQDVRSLNGGWRELLPAVAQLRGLDPEHGTLARDESGPGISVQDMLDLSGDDE